MFCLETPVTHEGVLSNFFYGYRTHGTQKTSCLKGTNKDLTFFLTIVDPVMGSRPVTS